MSSVEGHCDPRFDGLADAFAQALESGEEVGAAIAVDIDGETVVDIWGGHGDAARTRPWTTDTIVNVWSSTKTVTSLAALMLIDRGLVDPSAPVADYWPEFAANGKQHIEIRHVLSHTSGLSGWDQPVVTEDVYDWQASTAALAAQAPWWETGDRFGLPRVDLRAPRLGDPAPVTGTTLAEFVRDEIAGPLGADFQIGARPEDDGRIAEIIPSTERLDLPPLDQLPEQMLKTFSSPGLEPTVANTAAWRAADIGAANGHTNARALTRILSAVSLGGSVDRVRLLRPETIERIFEVQSDGPDLVLAGHPVRWGLGYGLPQRDSFPFIPDEKICFWGGWGGSWETMNPDRRMTAAYVMNKMGAGIEGSARTARYTRLIYDALS